MRLVSRTMTRRLAAFATLVTVGLVMLTAGAIENGKADSHPACTHGASSLGPIELRDGVVVGGNTTPTTEACLP
jgi:hypothetical protein